MTPSFGYRAADTTGRLQTGLTDGTTLEEARATLQQRGLLVVSLQPSSPTAAFRSNRRDLAVMMQSVAVLSNAGLSLERALEATATLDPSKLTNPLDRVRQLLREGLPLSQACVSAGIPIPAAAMAIVRAGEASGQLDEALRGAADLLAREADFADRMTSALAYPILLAVAGSGAVVLLVTVVIPRFAVLLTDSGQQLPFLTTAVLAVVGWSKVGLPLLGVAIVAIVCFFHRRLGDADFRRWWHETLRAAPMVGGYRRSLAAAAVGKTLGSMLEAGLPMVSALDATADALDDASAAARLREVRRQVLLGVTLARAIDSTGILTPRAGRLIAVGEECGRLGPLALEAGDLAAQEADRALRSAASMVEPALIIGFGLLIALVAGAMLQAVYAIRAVP